MKKYIYSETAGLSALYIDYLNYFAFLDNIFLNSFHLEINGGLQPNVYLHFTLCNFIFSLSSSRNFHCSSCRPAFLFQLHHHSHLFAIFPLDVSKPSQAALWRFTSKTLRIEDSSHVPLMSTSLYQRSMLLIASSDTNLSKTVHQINRPSQARTKGRPLTPAHQLELVRHGYHRDGQQCSQDQVLTNNIGMLRYESNEAREGCP